MKKSKVALIALIIVIVFFAVLIRVYRLEWIRLTLHLPAWLRGILWDWN